MKRYDCCCLVSQSFPALCDPMDFSTAGFSVFHHALEFTQIHVHWLSDAIQPSNHVILCCPLLLLPSICPSIRVFSNDSALCIRWPKYWSFSFSVSPSSEYSGLIFFRIDWLISFQSKGLSKVFSNTTVWKHLFLSHLDNKHTLWTIIFQKMHLEMSWWKLSAHVNVKKNSVDSIFKSTI